MDPNQMMQNPEMMAKMQQLMSNPGEFLSLFFSCSPHLFTDSLPSLSLTLSLVLAEIMALMQKPDVMAKLQRIMSDPSSAASMMNDPDVMKIVSALGASLCLSLSLSLSLSPYHIPLILFHLYGFLRLHLPSHLLTPLKQAVAWEVWEWVEWAVVALDRVIPIT